MTGIVILEEKMDVGKDHLNTHSLSHVLLSILLPQEIFPKMQLFVTSVVLKWQMDFIFFMSLQVYFQ